MNGSTIDNHAVDRIADRVIAAIGRLEAFVVRVDPPFWWASGYASPVYNDNRRLLADPAARRLVGEGFQALIARHGLAFDAVAGTASAGIAPATTLADALGMPLCYVRNAAKDHGATRRIEGLSGRELVGRRVLLVEDLITTGMSSASAAGALIEAGAEVVACVAIFSYGFQAGEEAFAALPGAPAVLPLCTVDRLIARFHHEGLLSEALMQTVRMWRGDPFGWGAAHGYPPKEKR